MISKRCCRKSVRTLKDLTFRKLSSKVHEKVWLDYEKFLMYRSIVAQFSRVMLLAMQSMLGKRSDQLSVEYAEESINSEQKPQLSELASEVQGLGSTLLIILGVGRIILFLVQIKRPYISKVNLYYEFVNNLVIQFMLPSSMNQYTAVSFRI